MEADRWVWHALAVCRLPLKDDISTASVWLTQDILDDSHKNRNVHRGMGNNERAWRCIDVICALLFQIVDARISQTQGRRRRGALWPCALVLNSNTPVAAARHQEARRDEAGRVAGSDVLSLAAAGHAHCCFNLTTHFVSDFPLAGSVL